MASTSRPKRTLKRTYKLEEMIKDYTAPISDVSDSEASDVQSDIPFDSESEDEEMFLDEAAMTLHHESPDLLEEGASPSKAERWNDTRDPDITPPQPTFRPNRSPGPQLSSTATYSALQLFQLFFTNSFLQTVVQNTNNYGSSHSPASSPWITLSLEDLFSFMSLVIYMGIVKCASVLDYWRGGRMFNLPFPKCVMSGKKFLKIRQNLHLASLEKNGRRTDYFDYLCKIKPIYDEIREACRRNYHPHQEIFIAERIVGSKARIGLKQYMKDKPIRWGYKLFALADSRTGYTWDFFVFEGMIPGGRVKGVSYDTVMNLMDTQVLGTGYKLFVDNFFTSPVLFHDLLKKRIWACGTIRPNRTGFPKTKSNNLSSKSPRGSIRWIREGSLLFVQWRDMRDVSLCSTIHTAHAVDTVQRKVRRADGDSTAHDVSIPPAVKEYNRCMGAVGLSDALIGCHQVHRETKKWHKTLFYHFMDIAIVNAFLLHKDLAKAKGEAHLTHKAFRETLVKQLAAVGSRSTARGALSAAPNKTHHRPVHISGHSTVGRQRCRHCSLKTPLKCSSCDVALCFIPGRDCYNEWHVANKL